MRNKVFPFNSPVPSFDRFGGLRWHVSYGTAQTSVYFAKWLEGGSQKLIAHAADWAFLKESTTHVLPGTWHQQEHVVHACTCNHAIIISTVIRSPAPTQFMVMRTLSVAAWVLQVVALRFGLLALLLARRASSRTAS